MEDDVKPSDVVDLPPENFKMEDALKNFLGDMLALQEKQLPIGVVGDGYVYTEYLPKDIFSKIREAAEKVPVHFREEFIELAVTGCSHKKPHAPSGTPFFPDLPRINPGYRDAFLHLVKSSIESHARMGQLNEKMEADVEAIIERFKIDCDAIVADAKRNRN